MLTTGSRLGAMQFQCTSCDLCRFELPCHPISVVQLVYKFTSLCEGCSGVCPEKVQKPSTRCWWSYVHSVTTICAPIFSNVVGMHITSDRLCSTANTSPSDQGETCASLCSVFCLSRPTGVTQEGANTGAFSFLVFFAPHLLLLRLLPALCIATRVQPSLPPSTMTSKFGRKKQKST